MSRHGGLGAVLLIVAALVAWGCQAPSARSPASPSPAPQTDRRVLDVDRHFFAGDYDGAETSYRDLARQGVPGAASHLSTLLAYENRFQEAVTEAQTGVATRSDSDSLARLTRALDWAEDVNGALATGARAVAARPVHPLAHAFYGEALADAGRFDAAQRELQAAEGMGGDAYVQAEIAREWSNYYRGRGDGEAALNYSELALKAQPGFPERQLDLVRFDYTNQRAAAARTLTDKLLAAHGKEYRVLVAAADAALTGADVERAPSLYQAAADVRAEGPEAALGEAEIAVAVSRDFNSAHDTLLAALRRSPTSSALYEYLRYLDLLVLKRDPASELASVAPQAPEDLAADRKIVMDRINARRSNLGLSPIAEQPALAEAAQAHAYFYLFNLGQQQQGAGVAGEDSSLPGFTGAASIDRDRHFGYSGERAGEIVSHAFTPQASAEHWADSILQRFPLLNRETATAGYGEARIGPVSIAVLDLGANAPGSGDPVVFPAPDQPAVPAAFSGSEGIDPLPQGVSYPIGYPVTLQVGSAQKLSVSTGRLVGPDGREVAAYPLLPAQQLNQAEWALLPRQPLRPGARYTVEVSGTIDGSAFSRQWSFTVGP